LLAMPAKTNAARAAATKARLIKAGRRLFARRGYAAVGTDEIVRAAKTTRGGLYYHFEDKRDLFRAVYEQIEADLAESIGKKLVAAGDDPLRMLQVGVAAFLDSCTDPHFSQICLVDAPAVLGWQEWRSVDQKYGLGLVTAGLELGVSQGLLTPQPVQPLAHLLLGAVGEAGMMIANAPDPNKARREVEPALIALVESLAREK